jgi:hypothetical protein
MCAMGVSQILPVGSNPNKSIFIYDIRSLISKSTAARGTVMVIHCYQSHFGKVVGKTAVLN